MIVCANVNHDRASVNAIESANHDRVLVNVSVTLTWNCHVICWNVIVIETLQPIWTWNVHETWNGCVTWIVNEIGSDDVIVNVNGCLMNVIYPDVQIDVLQSIEFDVH